jgi:hypothetical protein
MNSVLGVACTWTKREKGKVKKTNEFGVGRYLNLDKWGKKGKDRTERPMGGHTDIDFPLFQTNLKPNPQSLT